MGDILTIATADGLASAIVPGRLHYMSSSSLDLPTVGDWVSVRPGDPFVVEEVLPRISQLVRKGAGRSSRGQLLAANIDIGFIVTSANEEFSLPRLERFMSTVHAAGARPIVLVNKIDLPGSTEIIDQARSIAPEALALSATDGQGMSAFDAVLEPGSTHVFLGSSGVGKSTFANHVLGEQTMRTRELKRDDTGQHTTTHRELLLADSGVILIDTPGLRELGIWNSEGFVATFPDVVELFSRCRYRDCKHQTEPGCGVLKALAQGELNPRRWKAYGKLERETRRLSGRVASWQERQKRRAFAKRVKRATREKKRQREL
jgi:ribosome biogenesis GTPase